jgi:hypothetical protein
MYTHGSARVKAYALQRRKFLLILVWISVIAHVGGIDGIGVGVPELSTLAWKQATKNIQTRLVAPSREPVRSCAVRDGVTHHTVDQGTKQIAEGVS